MRSLLKKFTAGAHAPSSPASTGPAERPLAPRGRFLIGRTLAGRVSDDALSLAAVRHFGARRIVTDVLHADLPPGALPEAGSEFAISQVADFWSRHGGRGARFAACVAGDGVTVRTFCLPRMSRADLASAVEIEASRQIPFPVGEFTCGFRPVARLEGEGGGRCRVALLAATHRLLRQALVPLEQAAVPVQAVYAGAQAVGVLLTALPNFDPDRIYTLVRLGLRESETAFYRAGNLEFSHHGGTGTAMLGTAGDEARREFFAETLASEIQTSLDYFAGQHLRLHEPEVFVYGGAAGHTRLLRLLSERLGCPVEPFPLDRLAGIRLAGHIERDVALAALPAIAAALCRSDLVNLLPPDRRTEWRRRRVDALGRTAVAAVLLFLAAGGGFLYHDLHVQQETDLALRQQLALYENSGAYRALSSLRTRLAAADSYLKASAKNPTSLALNLKELSHLTPPEVRLTRYDFTPAAAGANLRLSGVVTSSDVPPEVVLAAFVDRLNAGRFFDSVTVERHVKRRQDETFILEFQLALRGRL